MREYVFRKWDEVGWGVVVAVATFATQVVIETDPDAVTDWRTWAISLAAGIARVAFAAAVAKRG